MRFGQWISLIALVISVYILWRIRQVLLLVFAATILATALNRGVRQLQRLRLKRGAAIAIVVVVLLLVISGFFAIIMPRLLDQLQQLTNIVPAVVVQLQLSYDWLQTRIPGEILEDNELLGALANNLQSWTSQLAGNLFTLFTNWMGIVLNLLLFVALTVMLLANPLQYRRVFVNTFPAFYRSRINEILEECEESIVGWVKGTLIAMVTIGLVSYVGLLILQVPLPLVNAMLAGLLEFIPNVGPTLSVIPPLLFALLDAPWKALAVIGLYVGIQQFESLILTPYVMKHEVSLMPAFTVLSVVIAAIFFGFLGLFLGIPLLVVIQVWLKHILINDIMNRWTDPPRRSLQSHNANDDAHSDVMQNPIEN